MTGHDEPAAAWHFEDSGDAERTPLVLLHGFTGCGRLWSEMVASLRSEFRCIAPDLPGHGKTQAGDSISAYQMPHVAAQLAHVLSSVEPQQTAVWGYSMGGRLALAYAIMFPERVSRLVLESASPGLADPTERRQRQESDERLAMDIEAKGVAAFVATWEAHPLFQYQRVLPESKLVRMRAIRLANTAMGLAMSLRGMGTGAQEPLHARLASLSVPTLILVGEKDDKFRAIGAQMARVIPSATYRVVPGAGHTTFWEQSEACLKIVRPFLLGEEPPDLLPERK